jgi:hypothetical protein
VFNRYFQFTKQTRYFYTLKNSQFCIQSQEYSSELKRDVPLEANAWLTGD